MSYKCIKRNNIINMKKRIANNSPNIKYNKNSFDLENKKRKNSNKKEEIIKKIISILKIVCLKIKRIIKRE